MSINAPINSGLSLGGLDETMVSPVNEAADAEERAVVVSGAPWMGADPLDLAAMLAAEAGDMAFLRQLSLSPESVFAATLPTDGALTASGDADNGDPFRDDGPITVDWSQVKDHDGNGFGERDAWKQAAFVDLDRDGDDEVVALNPNLGRWATIEVDSDRSVIYSGATRVVGVYEDPFVTSGAVTKGSEFDSATRFANDLKAGRLSVVDTMIERTTGRTSIIFKLNGEDTYLRLKVHADGNAEYANYMNGAQYQALRSQAPNLSQAPVSGDYKGAGQTVVIIDSGWSSSWDSGNVLYSYDFADNDSNVSVSETDPHGSLVTRTVLDQAADTNIIRLKVFSDNSDGAYYGTMERALQWVINNVSTYGIDAVNLSIGGGNTTTAASTPLSNEYQKLNSMGVITTVAAGNSGEYGVSLMAANSDVVTVSATDGNASLTWWTQRHPTLTDITADGIVDLTNVYGGHRVVQGTSFAAPNVAGAISRAQEAAYVIRGSALTKSEFLTVAEATGDKVGYGAYYELNTDSLMAELVNNYLKNGAITDPGDDTSTDWNGYVSAPDANLAAVNEVGGEYTYGYGWADEVIVGSAANNLFNLDYGDDTLTGGGGSDVFKFNSATDFDVVTDFDVKNDFLDLGYWATSPSTTINQSGGDSVISIYRGSSTITLKGVTASDWKTLRDVGGGAIFASSASDDDVAPSPDTDYRERAPTNPKRVYSSGGGWNYGWLNETVTGGSSDELFDLNYGNDTLTGGGGSDVFCFNSVTDFDIITDFNVKNDFLDMGYWARSSSTTATETSQGTVISIYHGSSTITLMGVFKSDWGMLRDATAGAIFA